MTIEIMTIPHLGGGIRNDTVSQAINPAESFDALNEDSSVLLGASSKRKGMINVGSLTDEIRCIYEGKAITTKRLVVAGSRMYEFEPPATFTLIYDGLEGDKHDFVRIAPFIDKYVGGIFVIMDGFSRPLYWDRQNEPIELPVNAPIAKFGMMHSDYFIMGNLTMPNTLLYDSSDLDFGSVASLSYDDYQEISLSHESGEIVGIIGESSTSGNYIIHIFSDKPIGWWNSTSSVEQYPMNTTGHVFSKMGITAKSYKDLNLSVDFYSGNKKLYVAVYNLDGSSATIKIRVLYKTKFYNMPQDIKWCDNGDINEWTISNTTNAGRLSLYTSEGGDIINLLPMNRNVFMVYKEDGSIIAVTLTGSSTDIFDSKTLTEGFKLVAGNAILPWNGYHWALSTEGFIQIDASSARLVEPYGKAKKIFDILNSNWSNSYGSALEKDHRIAISYPRGGVEEKDGVIVFDVKNGLYDKWDLALNVFGTCTIDDVSIVNSFTGFDVDDLAGYTVDDDRLKMQMEELYGGGYDGEVYRIGWTNNDDGVAIEAFSESGWIRPKGIEEKYPVSDKFWFRFIELELDMTGEFNLTLEYKVDYVDVWTTLPTISLSQGARGLVSKVVKRYVSGVGRAIKIRRKNSTAGEGYVIRSMNIGYEKVGGR